MDPSGQHWCTEQAVNFLSSVVHWQSGIKLYFIIYQKLCSVRWFQYQISFRKQFIFLENWFLFTLEQQMIMLFLMIYFYKQNKRWTLGCKWFCQSPFPAVRTLNRFSFNWCPRCIKVNITILSDRYFDLSDLACKEVSLALIQDMPGYKNINIAGASVCTGRNIPSLSLGPGHHHLAKCPRRPAPWLSGSLGPRPCLAFWPLCTVNTMAPLSPMSHCH